MQMLFNIIRLSIDNIRRKRSIYILLTLAVAGGTAIIIFLLMFAAGLKRTAEKNLMLLPLNSIRLRPSQTVNEAGEVKTTHITFETIEELKQDPEIKQLWPQVDYNGPGLFRIVISVFTYSQAHESPAEIYGVNSDLVKDNLFDDSSFEYKEGEPIPIVLPERIVRMLNRNISAMLNFPEEQMIRVDTVKNFETFITLMIDNSKAAGDNFKVIQCKPVGISMSIPQIGVAVPIEVVKEWNRKYGRPSGENRYSRVLIETAHPEKASALTAQFREKGFTVESGKDVYEQIKKIFYGVQGGILILGLLIVFSVGTGLFNGLNLVVYSERDIIGVMRAVGAKRKQIMDIVLLQGVWVGFAGGILGTILAFAVGFGIENTVQEFLRGYSIETDTLFTFSVHLLFGGCLIPAVVCLLFSIFPGLRAISLKPAEVLK